MGIDALSVIADTDIFGGTEVFFENRWCIDAEMDVHGAPGIQCNEMQYRCPKGWTFDSTAGGYKPNRRLSGGMSRRQRWAARAEAGRANDREGGALGSGIPRPSIRVYNIIIYQ
jgi:hypothetical protein